MAFSPTTILREIRSLMRSVGTSFQLVNLCVMRNLFYTRPGEQHEGWTAATIRPLMKGILGFVVVFLLRNAPRYRTETSIRVHDALVAGGWRLVGASALAVGHRNCFTGLHWVTAKDAKLDASAYSVRSGHDGDC